MARPRLDWIGGGCLLILSALVCLYSFWRIGTEARDALVLTSYVTRIANGQQQSFGYGGEREGEKVNVAFQGREMSNVAFIISRDDGGHHHIMGWDDDIRIRRTQYPARQQVELNDGDFFETRGPLGRAAFTARMEEEGNLLRLRLQLPLFRDIRSSPTRLVVGDLLNPTLSPVDEIFFRTTALSGPSAKTYVVWAEEGGLYMEEERDLAKLTAEAGGPSSAIAPAPPSPQPGAQTPCSGLVQGDCLRPGQSITLGTLEFTFRPQAVSPTDFWGWSSVRVWGLRIFLAISIIGLAFIVGPQARWPPGAVTAFGCVALFVSISLVLTARDFFLYPHQQRFEEYLKVLYWAVMLLFALRVRFGLVTGASRNIFGARLLLALACFLAAFFLIGGPLDGTANTFSSVALGALKSLLAFALFLTGSLAVQIFARAKLADLSAALQEGESFRRWLFVPLLLFALGLLVARFGFGAREALILAGIRVHLPTLLLPLLLLWASVLVWLSEAESEGREARLILVGAASFLVVLLYRLCSSDNGGAAVIALGVLAVFWLGCSKRVIPLGLTAVILGGLFFFAWINQPARFELAWGGEEGRMLFYDEAKNLRMARDMARAGGLFGNFTDLRIPAEMRSTLHNDLAVAYVIGFFGWGVFAVLFSAYAVFYNYLFRGLSRAIFSVRRGKAGAAAVPGGKDSLHVLLIFGGALVLTFMVQALWVILATLLSQVPFTGLDFQPVSASSISVISFFVVMLGSAAIAITLSQSFHE